MIYESRKATLDNYMNRKIFKGNQKIPVFKPVVFWEWDDIGLMFRIFKNTKWIDYHMSVDIQILWFNLWIQCFRKSKE